MALLLDTHVWIWSIVDSGRTPPAIRIAMATSGPSFVSVSSFYEVAYKARLGKWPEVAPYAQRLQQLARDQGARLVDIDGDIAVLAANLDWTHRDPFDRFIAASAISRRVPLVSADKQFDDLNTLPAWPGRLW